MTATTKDDLELRIYSAAELMALPFRPRPKHGRLKIVSDCKPVRSRAERLHPIWWQGGQWAVTAYGLEARDGTYSIEANRLDDHLAAEHPHSWPEHMARKNWVDVEDFITAWLVGMLLHGTGADLALVRAAVARTPTREQTNRENRQFDADLKELRGRQGERMNADG